MSKTFQFGNGEWAVGKETVLAYNDENNNFKPLPFSFDRASVATVVNKDGLIETVGVDEPRIDFLNNTKGHLLLEPSRTNNLLNSNQFDTTWTTANASVTSGQTGIGGSSDAWLLSKSGINGRVDQSKSLSGVQTLTVYAKSNTNNWFAIRVDSGTAYYAYFDLSNGVTGTTTSGLTSSMELINNGWYRCTITYDLAITYVRLYVADGDNDLSGTSGSVYIQYSQLEAGSYATSYIPTSGSAVTRSREICEQDNLTKVIGQTEGVIYYDYTATFEAPSTSFDFFPLSVSDGTTSNYFFLNNYNQKLTIAYNSGGVSVFSNNTFSFNSGDRIKIAFAYKQNDFAVYVNGTQILTVSSGSVGALNEITLGNYYNNSSNLQDDVKVNDVKLYNTRLSNSELQALTTI